MLSKSRRTVRIQWQDWAASQPEHHSCSLLYGFLVIIALFVANGIVQVVSDGPTKNVWYSTMDRIVNDWMGGMYDKVGVQHLMFMMQASPLII